MKQILQIYFRKYTVTGNTLPVTTKDRHELSECPRICAVHFQIDFNAHLDGQFYLI